MIKNGAYGKAVPNSYLRVTSMISKSSKLKAPAMSMEMIKPLKISGQPIIKPSTPPSNTSPNPNAGSFSWDDLKRLDSLIKTMPMT